MPADEGFDALLDRLKGLVEKMEHGNLSLEESLKTFEEGVALARQGHAVLDAAEKRVEMLVSQDGRDERVVPFRGTEPTGGA